MNGAPTVGGLRPLAEQGNALMESSPFPMARVDGAEHTIHSANAAFCKLTGKAEADLIGSRFAEYVPKDDGCLRVFERVQRTGKPESHTEQEQSEYDERDEHTHARALYWSYSVWPVHDAGRPGVVIQVTETARLHQGKVEVNQALVLAAVRQHGVAEITAKALEFEQRFRFLADSMPQKMFTAKPNGEIDYCNEQWMEYTGLSFAEFRDRGWQEFIHPEDVEENIRSWRQSIETGDPFLLEHRFRGKDGFYRWHLSRARAMRNDDGKIKMWVGTDTDIDDFRKSQEILIRVEKLAAAGRLAASIAHEINNPLEAVMNTLYLAGTTAGLSDDAREYLKIADGELMRIAHITRQTLGFYHEQTDPSTFFVSALLGSVVDVMQSKIKARRAQVEVRCDKALQMTGVFGEMRQVFANFLLNSLDAVGIDGKVRLKASRCSDFGCLRITVADDGNGISESALTRIFEPFFTTKGTIGTGLGLWVSKQIVEKHGGTVRVRSNTAGMRRGTAFSVVLPAAGVTEST